MQGYYRVPPTTREDIQILRRHVEEFKSGALSPTKFRGFRVPLGIYEQRQENTFMMRVRVPGGGITPSQLRELSKLGRTYNLKPHITTRQDLQLQNVLVDDLVPIYQELYKIGLTCKGGGGNTVRNITACPHAGVCPDEKFNVLPHTIGLTEYLIQFPSSYNLPRKFKIAFSGCSEDCALATVNDLGFIAKSQNGRDGFSVYAAGGMGAKSRVAQKLSDFVPADEIGYIAEAVKRLFDRYGDRKHKHQARLRFVLERFGFQKFKELYEEELKAVRQEAPIILEIRETEEKPPEGSSLSQVGTADNGSMDNNGYSSWKNLQASKQKQSPFYSVKIPVPLGDIEPGKLEKIADLVEKVGEKALRTTHTQDFLIRWVKEEDLPALYHELKELGIADTGNLNINYLVCCKGAATCKLGMCLSQGLSAALADTLDRANIFLSGLPDIDVRINGCPNACGHHPIGTIGLHGGSRRVNGRIAPYYNVLLGGLVEEGKTQLSKPFGYVSAKNIPLLLRDFLGLYLEAKDNYSSFLEFSDQKGEALLKELIHQYEITPSYEENPEYYFDWSSNEEFSLAGRGPGECGAGVLDMIEADLAEAAASYKNFEGTKESDHLYKAVVSASKSLLVARGLDPQSDQEALDQFDKNFIESGWVSQKYRPLIKAALVYNQGRKEELKENVEFVEGLVNRLKNLYESMDSNLQFQITPEEKIKDEGESEENVQSLDLRGVPCPVNYVKAKVVLEDLKIGDLLELLLDEGEPISNVPPSLENDGQEILNIRKENGYYFLKVRKKV